MKKFFIYVLIATLSLTACTTQQIQNTMGAILGTANADPTEEEAGGGIKEALIMGIINGTGLLSKQDGFLGNSLVKIPWPEQAKPVMDAMLKLGMNKQVDNVTTSLNRAAEKASGVAVDVFVSAIKQLTIKDALQIVTGGEGAGTNYLRKVTTPILIEKFRPLVDNSLGQVGATKYWSDATGVYNKIPFVKPVSTDLTGFVTDKALQGVFTMVEKEENKIRKDPFARTSDLLKKVFSFADRNKK